MTKESNNDTAKNNFIKRLNHSDMYFIQEEIPKNESDEKAHVLCGDVEGAIKYCPTRWQAMQNWFAEAEMVSEQTGLSSKRHIAKREKQTDKERKELQFVFSFFTALITTVI